MFDIGGDLVFFLVEGMMYIFDVNNVVKLYEGVVIDGYNCNGDCLLFMLVWCYLGSFLGDFEFSLVVMFFGEFMYFKVKVWFMVELLVVDD